MLMPSEQQGCGGIDYVTAANNADDRGMSHPIAHVFQKNDGESGQGQGQ